MQKDKIKIVSQFIKERKDEILKEWKEQLHAKKEHTSGFTTMSINQFYDSIPDVLDDIKHILEDNDDRLQEYSRKHGNQHWEHSIMLKMVTDAATYSTTKRT